MSDNEQDGPGEDLAQQLMQAIGDMAEEQAQALPQLDEEAWSELRHHACQLAAEPRIEIRNYGSTSERAQVQNLAQLLVLSVEGGLVDDLELKISLSAADTLRHGQRGKAMKWARGLVQKWALELRDKKTGAAEREALRLEIEVLLEQRRDEDDPRELRRSLRALSERLGKP